MLNLFKDSFDIFYYYTNKREFISIRFYESLRRREILKRSVHEVREHLKSLFNAEIL